MACRYNKDIIDAIFDGIGDYPVLLIISKPARQVKLRAVTMPHTGQPYSKKNGHSNC